MIFFLNLTLSLTDFIPLLHRWEISLSFMPSLLKEAMAALEYTWARPVRIDTSLPHIRFDLRSVMCSQAVIGLDFPAQLLNGIGLGLYMVKGPE